MPQQMNLFTGKPSRTRSALASNEGYAARPGTGPAGMTCGVCLNFRRKAFKFRKACAFKCHLVTDDGTRKTDIIKSMPACTLFAPANATPADPAS